MGALMCNNGGMASKNDYIQNKWRVGRKVGRTVYAQVGDEPSDNDLLIGVFDTKELAQAAVDAHNKLRKTAPPS